MNTPNLRLQGHLQDLDGGQIQKKARANGPGGGEVVNVPLLLSQFLISCYTSKP